ncbi:hypothetical protein GWN26_12770 [Candidatus Saccharibacteria bacterium]|nr:hypothetical protein [Candidatus Saccharibacteria bacterium]NIV04280.1 hypothetical protein [Calditrichia bacterium]NIS38821.1 hypothetical protein [Candidatus Saccharibacteria bacterium]NIV72768.1 hypothetical protein [Calditrichia bacterium]NIV99940.1 hypothetical protein [Candidatus Saccharibacteria bacterium]
MPIITVSGIHNPSLDLNGLSKQIKRAVSGVGKLKLTEEQVTVFFPPDMNGIPHSEEIVVKIEGLFESPERTSAVRKTLANCVGAVVESFAREHLRHCRLIEVLVYEFRPATGFASIELKPEKEETQSD